MLPAKSNWSIRKLDNEAAERLAQTTGFHPMLAKLLVMRGFHHADEAKKFMQADLECLHNPFLLDGMSAAVERIQKAIDQQEFIRIYGDYDADGVSSTAIMVRLFRNLGAQFDYYIPHRTKEGYGLNMPAIDDAKRCGVTLIITVDNGISSKAEIEYAKSLGIEVVVTDHHEPPEHLPDQAVACINPRKSGCPYPFKGLAGAGVAWKLAHAMCGEVPEELAEIAAIGTIADLMPMTDENRAIVTMGLKRMQTSRIAGLQALFDLAGLAGQAIDETHIGFAIGPRINAAGRLAHADLAVRLLITEDLDEASRLAVELDQLNKQRQTVVDKLTKEAQLQAEQSFSEDRVIVLAGENWHVGVVGIAASRILEKWYRPVVILSIDPETGEAKGSARSIDGFDIHRALTACDDLLEHYGGHQAAGGMSLKAEHIESFRQRLNDLADEWLSPEHFVPTAEADLVCSLQDITLEAIEEISKLAPFGIGNPSPRFVLKDVKADQLKRLGKTERHLKITLRSADDRSERTRIDALAFGLADLDKWITPWAKLNIYGELSINEWNGKRTPQIRVNELKVEERQVFDWRGVKTADNEWKKWLQAGQSCGSSPSRPVVLGNASPEQLHAYGMDAICCPYDELEHPEDSAVGLNEVVNAKELILYSLPPGLTELKSALRQFSNVERIIVWLHEENPFTTALPSRDSFKQVYVRLKHDGLELDREAGLRQISRETKLSQEMIHFIIEVFRELGFVQTDGSKIKINPAPEKKELHTSISYKKRKEKQELEKFLLQSTGSELASWLLRQLPEKQGAASGNNKWMVAPA